MDILSLAPLTANFGKPGLTNGTTTTYTIATAFNYAIRGKSYNKGTASNATTPTTDIVTGAAFVAQPIGYGCVYLWLVNSAGTVAVAQGTQVALDVTGAFINLPQFPAVPDGYCPFAYEVVRLAPSTATTPAVATWTMGTNNQSSVTGVTFAFQDISTLPDDLQGS